MKVKTKDQNVLNVKGKTWKDKAILIMNEMID